MSYQSFSRKKKKPLLYLLVIGIFVLYLIFVGLSRAGILDISVYVKNSVNGTADFFGSLVSDKNKLIEENKNLKYELEKERLKNLYQNDMYDHNLELLSRLEVSENQRVIFSIYSRPGFNLYDAMLASGGDVSKVREGDTYYSSEFFALGKVKKVRGNSVVLGMFSTPGEKTNISLKNSIFVAEGQGAGSMQVKVPRDFEVDENDVVYLAGEVNKIIGDVKEVNLDPQDSFKVVIFKTPVNIFSIDKIEVETGSALIKSSEINGLLFEEEILDPEIFDSLEQENSENETN